MVNESRGVGLSAGSPKDGLITSFGLLCPEGAFGGPNCVRN